MLQANLTLRSTLREKDIPLWKVANKLGVSEMTLIRWLRMELDESRLEQIKKAISLIEEDRR